MRTHVARPLVTTVALAALALGATACGGEDPAADAPQDGGETTFAPEEPSTEPSSEPAAPPSEDGDIKPGAVETLTGTVRAGVEPGCRVLEIDGQSLLLVGAEPDAAPDGERVTVTGVREPDALSTCQEGVPFRVRSVESAD